MGFQVNVFLLCFCFFSSVNGIFTWFLPVSQPSISSHKYHFTFFQNGVSFSPKHGLFLKPELCIVAFRRDHTPLTSFISSTLRHLDDVRISVRPYYVVESHEHLRQVPRAKLYLVVFEIEERVSSSGQDSDLITSTVRYIKSLGGKYSHVFGIDGTA